MKLIFASDRRGFVRVRCGNSELSPVIARQGGILCSFGG